MRQKLMTSTSWKWVAAVLLSAAACKQAGYQVLKPGLENPNSFDGFKTVPPTARVEVIDRGVSVTWIYAGSRVDIRPSADTLDADYVGKSTCDNPGIVMASYDLGNGAKPSVKRDNCDTLATVGQTFTTPGDYVIKLQVTSQDNETANASMTLRVVDKSVPASQVEGGFTIHAKPLLANINAPVTFTGICELKGKLTINWDYGDQAAGAGAVTQHSYTKAGQYFVQATCSSDSGKKMTAALTVVVMNNPPAVPDVPVPVPGNNPNLPKNPGCDPTQGPCQNAGQVPNGQQLPDKTGPVWYYDPFCRCYIRQ